MRLVTPQQIKYIDEYIERESHLPLANVMEQAGRSIYERVKEIIQKETYKGRITLLCGTGNNGGDALVVARLLGNVTSQPPYVVIIGDPSSGSPLFQEQLKVLSSLEEYVHILYYDAERHTTIWDKILPDTSIVIDGIYGTGFRGKLPDHIQEIFAKIMTWKASHPSRYIVAIDIPSGVDGTLGQADTMTLTVDETVTLLAPKVGMYIYPGREKCGSIRIGDIGYPFLEKLCFHESQESYLDSIWLNTKESLFLPRRHEESHKGTHGHVYIYGGSPGIYGAPLLSAEGALRSGAGKVTILCKEENLLPLQCASRPEIMIRNVNDELPLDKHRVAIIGPGGGRQEENQDYIRTIMRECTSSMVIDADGIVAIAQDLDMLRQKSRDLREKGKQIVLTPHLGEFSILTGVSIDDIKRNPLQHSSTFAKEYGVVLVLKGQPTYIAYPDGTVYLNITGNPYMGTGGMGDVLAGIIGSLMNQTEDIYMAIRLAVYIHSATADVLLETRGPGYTPTEVAKHLGLILQEIKGYTHELSITSMV